MTCLKQSQICRAIIKCFHVIVASTVLWIMAQVLLHLVSLTMPDKCVFDDGNSQNSDFLHCSRSGRSRVLSCLANTRQNVRLNTLVQGLEFYGLKQYFQLWFDNRANIREKSHRLFENWIHWPTKRSFIIFFSAVASEALVITLTEIKFYEWVHNSNHDNCKI